MKLGHIDAWVSPLKIFGIPVEFHTEGRFCPAEAQGEDGYGRVTAGIAALFL